MSRISHYPVLDLETGIRLHLAHTWRARLLGLALMPSLHPDDALVIPHCTSVHTFGMRFPIDVVFVDRDWLPIYIEYDVGPWRVLRSRFARSVIEVAAGETGRLTYGLRMQGDSRAVGEQRVSSQVRVVHADRVTPDQDGCPE